MAGGDVPVEVNVFELRCVHVDSGEVALRDSQCEPDAILAADGSVVVREAVFEVFRTASGCCRRMKQ